MFIGGDGGRLVDGVAALCAVPQAFTCSRTALRTEAFTAHSHHPGLVYWTFWLARGRVPPRTAAGRDSGTMALSRTPHAVVGGIMLRVTRMSNDGRAAPWHGHGS